jgi:hypothetical protein
MNNDLLKPDKAEFYAEFFDDETDKKTIQLLLIKQLSTTRRDVVHAGGVTFTYINNSCFVQIKGTPGFDLGEIKKESERPRYIVSKKFITLKKWIRPEILVLLMVSRIFDNSSVISINVGMTPELPLTFPLLFVNDFRLNCSEDVKIEFESNYGYGINATTVSLDSPAVLDRVNPILLENLEYVGDIPLKLCENLRCLKIKPPLPSQYQKRGNDESDKRMYSLEYLHIHLGKSLDMFERLLSPSVVTLHLELYDANLAKILKIVASKCPNLRFLTLESKDDRVLLEYGSFGEMEWLTKLTLVNFYVDVSYEFFSTELNQIVFVHCKTKKKEYLKEKEVKMIEQKNKKLKIIQNCTKKFDTLTFVSK